MADTRHTLKWEQQRRSVGPARAMVQLTKRLPAVPTSHMDTGLSLGSPFLIQLLLMAWESTGRGPKHLGQYHMGHQPAPALTNLGFWGVNPDEVSAALCSVSAREQETQTQKEPDWLSCRVALRTRQRDGPREAEVWTETSVSHLCACVTALLLTVCLCSCVTGCLSLRVSLCHSCSHRLSITLP